MAKDHDHAQCVADQAWLDEPVTVTGSDLLFLLGRTAMPPFPDHPEADHWDCAVLAERLTAAARIFHAEAS